MASAQVQSWLTNSLLARHMQNSSPMQNAQSAYHEGRNTASGDVDLDLFEAMRQYLTEDFGLPGDVATERAKLELVRGIPKSMLRDLSRQGISVAGQRVLDLGAGLGGLSEELMLAGALVLSLEPGGAWATLTQRRLERHQREFELLNAFGESIPLPDASVDLIVSLQVLEHVQDPRQVLAEVWRILRPGGHFYLSCENYLAFWEPHYRLPWFPLMPKPVGSLFLRLLGRSPKFLQESITYVTLPGVLRDCRKLGFVRLRDEELADKVANGAGTKWQLTRALSTIFGRGMPQFLDDARSYFRVGIHELLRKPAS